MNAATLSNRTVLCRSALAAAVLATAVSAQSLELNADTSRRLVDLTPTTSFCIGMASHFQIQAGALGTEGLFCVVYQPFSAESNVPHTIPGYSGLLYIDEFRNDYVFAAEGGPLTGGIGPGQSIVFTYVPPAEPWLIGLSVIVQGFATNEALTERGFTTALLGTFKFPAGS